MLSATSLNILLSTKQVYLKSCDPKLDKLYFNTISTTIHVIIQRILKVWHTWIGNALKESLE